MIVLDASVLIGYLDGQDDHHDAAEALFAAAVDDDLAANPLTLGEVLVVPARDGRLDAVLGVLHDLEVAELAFPPDMSSRLARLRARTGLRMPDCCVLLSAEVTGASLASFDERLLRAAERHGVSVLGGMT